MFKYEPGLEEEKVNLWKKFKKGVEVKANGRNYDKKYK